MDLGLSKEVAGLHDVCDAINAKPFESVICLGLFTVFVTSVTSSCTLRFLSSALLVDNAHNEHLNYCRLAPLELCVRG
jgi:hypothetical protein